MHIGGTRGVITTAAVLLGLFWCLPAQGATPSSATAVENGSFTIHLMLHAIGEEKYEIARTAQGPLLRTSSEYSDRGRKTEVSATLQMKNDLSVEHLEVRHGNAISTNGTMQTDELSRIFPGLSRYFAGFGATPATLQMMMMRYWMSHGEPQSLPPLRASASAPAAEIKLAGHDVIQVAGKNIPLKRYTVANIIFGREVLWMNGKGQLAALMTFAGGLPFEFVRTEYEPAFSQLIRDGVTQEIADMAALDEAVRPEASGNFAIVGATLIDGTGRPIIPDSVVLVRQGRIAAAGARGSVTIPHGMKVVDATGKTMLPGLWEMHTHYSGVEFGPALLAAGITTARDCGGEFEFLTTTRDYIAEHHARSPRLLLAGLVDASGLAGFGNTFADTPEQARKVVQRYHAAGFKQIKLYTYLQPEVIRALTEEAHRLGMTVTGHIPEVFNAIQGVEAGMDQINHLGYVTKTLRTPGEKGSIDLNSTQAKKAIEFYLQHHTVVDDTASWGEMAGHSKDLKVASFEPGIDKAPYSLASKLRALGSPASDSAKFQARMAETRAVILALYKAGVPIVAGSDTGLQGYGLLRELEIYVQAGMTPMEAIQSATIVPARAMGLDKEAGTVEVGKRADLILVDGNPLEHISDIRKVSHVVADGRMYNSAKLWESVGFRP